MSGSPSDLMATVLRERIRLGRFIRGRVRNPADADDILQDVLFEFIEAYHLPAPIEQASAWLICVARNRIIDLFRKNKDLPHETAAESGVEPRAFDAELQLPAPDNPEAAYARSVLLVELRGAIDELPSEQRTVFVAREIDGVSFSELASRTGLSINTLIARKRYAVLKLRRRLQAIHDELDI